MSTISRGQHCNQYHFVSSSTTSNAPSGSARTTPGWREWRGNSCAGGMDASQSDLDWQINKGKCKDVHLWQNNFWHEPGLEDKRVEDSFAEENTWCWYTAGWMQVISVPSSGEGHPHVCCRCPSHKTDWYNETSLFSGISFASSLNFASWSLEYAKWVSWLAVTPSFHHF